MIALPRLAIVAAGLFLLAAAGVSLPTRLVASAVYSRGL
jgi:hypothetical protein